MKKLILLASALLFVLGSLTTSFGNTTVAPLVSATTVDDNGELPPPSFLVVTNVTESKISLMWTAVPNAVQYRVTAKVAATNVLLSSNVITVSGGALPTYTVENLPAATDIVIGVSATSVLWGDFGEERTLVQQTDNIIIIDIVTFLPCNAGDGNDIAFTNDVSEELVLDPNPNQDGLFQESTLRANKPASGNKPGWTVKLSMVGRICPNGSTKYVCRTAGSENVTWVPNLTQGTIQFKNNNQNVLKVFDIQKVGDPNNYNISFNTLRENYTPETTFKFNSHCNDVSLTPSPCTTTTYAQSGTPPGRNNQMAIHANEIGEANNTSIADFYYNRDGSVAEQYRTADSRGNIGVNDEDIIDLIPTEESLAVSPNPFNDFTNIQYQVTKQSPVTMMLYNAMGQIQKEILNDGNMAPGYYSLPMDVSDLQPGVYFLTIQTQSGRKITTVVKQ